MHIFEKIVVSGDILLFVLAQHDSRVRRSSRMSNSEATNIGIELSSDGLEHWTKILASHDEIFEIKQYSELLVQIVSSIIQKTSAVHLMIG